MKALLNFLSASKTKPQTKDRVSSDFQPDEEFKRIAQEVLESDQELFDRLATK